MIITEQKADEVIVRFSARWPQTTVLNFTDGKVLEGFFFDFDDYYYLLEKAKCRFIPMANVRKMNAMQEPALIEYTIIIDLNSLSSIYVINNTGTVLDSIQML